MRNSLLFESSEALHNISEHQLQPSFPDHVSAVLALDRIGKNSNIKELSGHCVIVSLCVSVCERELVCECVCACHCLCVSECVYEYE